MKVSVIIPSYSHAPYIGQAIRSVLEQDWPDMDLIVIDDGSRDNSPQIIKDLLEGMQGCRYVLRENRGVIKTLNQGLEMVEGECVCFLSSDDYLRPGSLRVRAEHLEMNADCVAVYADGKVVQDSGETGKTLMSERMKNLFLAEDPIYEILKNKIHLPILTLMVRTPVLRSMSGFDCRYSVCEDMDIHTQLFLSGRVGYVDQFVHCYRRHKTNVSIVMRDRLCVDRVLCYLKYRDEFPQLAPYKGLIRYRLIRAYLALGRYLSRDKRSSELERSVFQTGWSYAWRDCRLLWHFICFRLGLYR